MCNEREGLMTERKGGEVGSLKAIGRVVMIDCKIWGDHHRECNEEGGKAGMLC